MRRAAGADGPPRRVYPALAYDAARGRCVLFGGVADAPLGDTWTWNGSAWQAESPAASPGPRFGATLTYDEQRQKLLLVGGSYSISGGCILSEAWLWNGVTWSAALPAPRPRCYHAAAYDRLRGRVILAGGFTPGSDAQIADVAQWDGVRWQELDDGPARADLRMEWDVVRQQFMLFGGTMPTAPWFSKQVWVGADAHVCSVPPVGGRATVGAPFTLHAEVQGFGGVIRYEWFRGNELICSRDGRFAGADTDTLTIVSALPIDNATFYLVAYDGASVVVSPGAELRVWGRGDMNCDGVVDFRDINPFVLALTDQAAWEARYPACSFSDGDVNNDGAVNFKDINAFVALLSAK